MRYALIGKDISHSRSPELYKKLISPNIQYDLIDIPNAHDLPQLDDLSKIYTGINITSPYKRSYFSSVVIQGEGVKELGAINTLCFSNQRWMGTNTDLLAVQEILQNLSLAHDRLNILVLGSGVMAQVTLLAAKNLNLNCQVIDRQAGLTSESDLRPFYSQGKFNIIINACSRAFVFNGAINSDTLFWDFNYNFIPHQSTLPLKVSSYLDGQELLELQAQKAAAFWSLSKY
jgi:shikimate dehydrogenase